MALPALFCRSLRAAAIVIYVVGTVCTGFVVGLALPITYYKKGRGNEQTIVS